MPTGCSILYGEGYLKIEELHHEDDLEEKKKMKKLWKQGLTMAMAANDG